MNRIALRIIGALAVTATSFVQAQQNKYTQTNLVSNQSGIAHNTDSQLSNPWGIAFLPGNPFWVANNNGGTMTTYDSSGTKLQPTVTVPVAANNPCPQGCPTGLVANSSTDFGGAQFITGTEDGIIARWNGAGAAVTAVDNSGSGAVYKGLALLRTNSGGFLLAANFRAGRIDVFDRNFQPASLSGHFTDPGLSAGMAPHGIKIINNTIYVAYAMQDSAKHDPLTTAGSGAVDAFDQNGNFVKRVVTGGALNAPWGMVMAPSGFGAFANALLVGNFGDGTINAFDANTGNLLGQMMDSNSRPVTNPGIWDMVFGQAGTGDPSTLYITAGGADQTQGLFAAIVADQAVSGPDFSLSASTQTATVARGGSAMITISAAGADGFNSPISLSCSSTAGISCAFSPSTINPGQSSTMQLSVASTYSPAGTTAPPTTTPTNPTTPANPTPTPMPPYTPPGMMILPGSFGAFGCVLLFRRRKIGTTAAVVTIVLLAIAMLTAAACSSGSSGMGSSGAGGATVTVTGRSGALVHTVPLNVSVH